METAKIKSSLQENSEHWNWLSLFICFVVTQNFTHIHIFVYQCLLTDYYFYELVYKKNKSNDYTPYSLLRSIVWNVNNEPFSKLFPNFVGDSLKTWILFNTVNIYILTSEKVRIFFFNTLHKRFIETHCHTPPATRVCLPETLQSPCATPNMWPTI